MGMPVTGTPTLAGKVIDYVLGRNTLIGVASFMLLIISGYATWHGMRDFIIGVAATPVAPAAGGLSIPNDVLVITVCVALTFLLWLALRETFGVGRHWRERLITFPLYLFLAIWSIGFGYGFWWSLISGSEATRVGLAGLEEDARDASAVVVARLDAVRGQLDNVVAWSESQMAREEASGGSCGTQSGAGRGPLYNARRSVRDSVSSLRDSMNKSWLEPVQADVERLRQAAAGLGGATLEERQRDFEARAADIRGRARNIAARSNQLGRATAAEMLALANALAISPGAPGFACYDPTLADRLRQAAAQAAQPAELKLRAAVFNEGPAGVANAVKNLWSNIGTYASSLFAYLYSGGKVALARTEEGEPITGRDLIALLATIGVDLGLLALAILNPPREPPSIRPSGTLTRQIRAAIATAISRAAGADLEWVHRHFIHHNRASYLVIPNLYSSDPENAEESAKALAVNQLAGVLSDLGLVRWPKPARRWLLQKSELERLKREEAQTSDTDLTAIRKKWAAEHGLSPEEVRRYAEKPAVRNHGLFSKAERALQIAGWSERARNDIEIFRLVDTDGLTPLLMVLNERGAQAPLAPEEDAGAPEPRLAAAQQR
jgi:hypothetical protein